MIIDPSQVPTSDIYRVMLRTVLPRPIAWVSTLSKDGVRNLAPFSWFNAVSANPPLVYFAPGRSSDGSKKDTLCNVEETGEFVVTIVPDTNNLSIGSDVPGVLEIFYGDIDDVRIYARALSASDVTELAGPVTSAPLPSLAATGIDLGRAFPNPATHSTVIPFSLAAATAVDLEILDVAGRRVRRLLVDQPLAAGAHSAGWDARDGAGRPVIGGVYLYRLSTPQGAVAGKVLVRR